MKVFVRKNNNTQLGYELVVKHDDDSIEVKAIVATDPKNSNILKLPDNPSNRKWLSISKIGEELELEYKETRTLGPRTETSPRKGLEEYLTGEDKETYLRLVELARKNREEANKKQPMSEADKLKAKIAKYQEMLKQYENTEVK